MAIDRDEMIRTAALNLLRIADALEQSEAPEAPEAEEAVGAAPEAAAAKFKCDGCDHAIGLDEINAKNKEFAGDVEVDPITAEDKIRCPECGKGIMAVVTEEAPEASEGGEGAEALPDGDDDADDDAAEDMDLTDKAVQPPTAVEGPGLTGHPAEANPMAQPLVVEAPAVAVEAPAAVAVVEDDEHEEKETPEEEAAEHSREAFMQAVRMASLSIEI